MARDSLKRAEAVVCPACRTRMPAGRERCTRCGTRLQPAHPGGKRPPKQNRASAKWHVLSRPTGVVVCGIVGLGMILALLDLRNGQAAVAGAVCQRDGVVPAVAGAVATDLASKGSAPPDQAYAPDLQQKARLEYQSADFETALAGYRRAVEHDPQDAESLNNCGQVLVRLGRPAEALAYFERAIALNAETWSFHFNYARAYGLLGQWEQAVEQYTEASRLFPDDEVTEYNFGLALLKTGDAASAAEHFRRAIALSPLEADFYLSLAMASDRLGQDSETRAALLRYLELQPSGAQAASARARLAQLKTGSSPNR